MLVENALFATLDPTVRRAETPSGRLYTLADTVGFVRHLPHHLVEAFRSTMEEVGDSDLILHVVDGSHPDPEEQLAAVREVIRDVGATDVPEIVVINKADAADPLTLQRLLRIEKRSIAVSARTGQGIDGAARPDRQRAAAARRSRSRPSCRTPTASWSPARTPRAR